MATKKKDPTIERVEAKLDILKEHFDSHMLNVIQHLDRNDNRLGSVDVTLVKQQAILDEHVRRTDVLEKKVDEDRKILQASLDPLKEQGAQISLIMKILVGLLGLGGGAAGLKELVSMITGG